MSEFQRELPPLCYTCGKQIDELSVIYSELKEIGFSGEQIFEVLNVSMYCCKARIANRPQFVAKSSIDPENLTEVKSKKVQILDADISEAIKDPDIDLVLKQLNRKTTKRIPPPS